MFLLGLSAVGMAVAVSLVWIYSEGKLDTPSVQAALSAIQLDMEESLADMSRKTSLAWHNVATNAKPFVDDGVESCAKAWKDGGKSLRQAAKYVEKNYGDWFASVWDQVGPYITLASQKIRSLIMMIWEGMRPSLEAGWEWSKPHFRDLGKLIIDNGQIALDWLEEAAPVFMDWLNGIVLASVRVAGEAWQAVKQNF